MRGVASPAILPHEVLDELFALLAHVVGLPDPERLAGDKVNRPQVGPTLRWPILSGGRVRAQIRSASARAEAASIRYERTVLNALADSETAINRFAAAGRTRLARDAAAADALEAVGLANRRYRAGEDDLTSLLVAQSAAAVANRQRIQARAAELQAMAALYKALGGGWQAT